MPSFDDTDSRDQILDLVSEYYRNVHSPKPFVPGLTPVPVGGRVFDELEMRFLVESALDFWLTSGRFNDAFEERLSEFLSIPHVLTTNSGSSANLLAVAALTSPRLGDRALKPGDEVLTVAAGFPTTINPILLYGLVPVFVDVDIPTYNVNFESLSRAVSKKTKAIVLAHTLGNPFPLTQVMQLAEAHGLWVIEDCCDALGSKYSETRVGTFGHIATTSFYPAHHITMGEGGAVFTRDRELFKILRSIRDWGRDCYCGPGADNTCGRRYAQTLGTLPHGYDHKYTYSHLGFNLKITDMQAAVGLAQLSKLEGFIQARKNNFNRYSQGLEPLSDHLELPVPTEKSEPSWFGYPITLRKPGLKREDLLLYLADSKIETRLLFGGNLTRQPYLAHYRCRVEGNLVNTDTVMNQTFWLGVYPGLGPDMIDYVVEKLCLFFS